MLPCTFRQLEIFLAAAEDCHFARTANRLGISQPAVTHHILALENQLGKTLFVRRRGTTPVLSTDGMALLKQARSLLAEGEKIDRFRKAGSEGQTATVRICAGAHILEDYLKPRLYEFYEEASNIAVECLVIDTHTQGLQMLRKGAADLMLFAASTMHLEDMHGEVLRRIRFGLYAAPGLAPADASPEDISALPFIMPPEGSPQDRMVQQALTRVGVECSRIAMRAQFTDVMADLAKRGAGVAALFDTMVEEDIARGELMAFDLELPPRYRAMFRLDRKPGPEMERVQTFLRRILR